MRKTHKILIVLLSILLIVSYSSVALAAPADHTSGASVDHTKGASADHGAKKGKSTDENNEPEEPIITPEEEEIEEKSNGNGNGNDNDNGNGNNDDTLDYTLNIVKVTTDQIITFDWDLDGALVAQEQNNNEINNALFQIQALRYIESNELTVSVKAELSQEIKSDTITVILGDKVDDNFEAIRTYEINEFTQSIVNGTSLLSLNIDVNLLDFSEEELALLQKIRLSIPVVKENGNTANLTTTHKLSLPENPTTLNAEAIIETNLLEALEELGTADVLADDWTVKEEDLGLDNSFNKEIQLSLDAVENTKNLIVRAKIKSDNGTILDEIKISLGSVQDEQIQNVWNGETHNVHGFWLPPVTENFVLGRKSAQVKFWLETKPSEPISIHIYESNVDDSGTIIPGDFVTEITNDNIRTRNCGNHARTWGENQPGGYYKFILKYKDLPSLEVGSTYILAVMIGEDILTFDEDSVAMLSFEVSEDASAAKNTSKTSFTRAPKRTGSKRNN